MLNVSIWEEIWKWEVEVIYESVWEAKPILLVIIFYTKLKKLWQLDFFSPVFRWNLFQGKVLSNLASLYYMMFQNSLLNMQKSFI